jgi:hypothetical protein
MWHHTDWMCFVKYLEPVTAFHFCVCTRHAFYIVMLTSFHRKESKKYLLCAIWTKSHALFHCLGLCSSVLKPLPLFHVLSRVDLPGEVCRISSCPENRCDCCTQVFPKGNHRETVHGDTCYWVSVIYCVIVQLVSLFPWWHILFICWDIT